MRPLAKNSQFRNKTYTTKQVSTKHYKKADIQLSLPEEGFKKWYVI